jgi:hypothetical protein
MLFGYPLAATEENWLHKCLCEVLQSIHTHIDTDKPVPLWPDIIPLGNIPKEYRDTMKRRTGLRDRINIYQKALVKLSKTKREEILQTLNDQNQIPLLLSCQLDCRTINDLPKTVRKPIRDLFEFAFELLTALDIRDKHYKLITDEIRLLCPFCGSHPFSGLGSHREELDHYLLASKYPFAGSNLRNLVPMCHTCNSSYKHGQDMLYSANGTRRRSFDPYHCSGVRLSLENSQPFAGMTGENGEPLPKWQIDFIPNSEESTTWDDVFHIRERYQRDVLNERFSSYLSEFGSYCKSWDFIPTSTEEIIGAIKRYISYQEGNEFKNNDAFLKAAVFRMLYVHCQNGNQDLIASIKNVVKYISDLGTL